MALAVAFVLRTLAVGKVFVLYAFTTTLAATFTA
jgi:hypothetical protein